jgi:TetR/AcrR family transcriptional regulator, transcriptional repressor for nem operon
MPYAVAHRKKVKERVIYSARQLFNRHGLDKVSINQVTASAQLTRGGCYSYFASKSVLYAGVLGCFARNRSGRAFGEEIHIDVTAAAVGPHIFRAYLSRQHFEDVENSCPVVALPCDVARSGESAPSVFATVFKAMVSVLKRGVSSTEHRRRAAAQAVAAVCVKSMVGARASAGRTLADEP